MVQPAQASMKRLSAPLFFLNTVPGWVALLLVLLSAGSWPFELFAAVRPPLVLAAFFFWSLSQPKNMPLWIAALLGLLADALAGLPLGLSTLLYILFLASLHSEREPLAKAGFYLQWFWFSLASCLFFALQWLVMSLLNWYFFNPAALFLPWMTLLLLYPPLHKLMEIIHHALAKLRWKWMHKH